MTVSMKAAGAELTSIKDAEGTEYLWQADPAVWGRHAPILFPIVGRLVGDRYTHGGKEYRMGQHGFARDREFCVQFASELGVTYELRSDDTSRAIYPFDFSLIVEYALAQNAPRLDAVIVVTNTGTDPLHFSVGIHPAFRCPLRAGESFDDYELVFDRPLSGSRQVLVNGLRTSAEPFFDQQERLLLTPMLFARDAIVLDYMVPRVAEVRRRAGGRGIALETTAPGHWSFYGIWSKADAAGNHHFVCLEPWMGVASRVDEGSELSLKDGILELAIGERATFSYAITFVD